MEIILLQNTKFNIMIKIFLCSSLADAAQLLSKFVVQLQRKIVAFIPTASINEEHTYYVVDGKTALKYLGLVVKELGALCDEKSIPHLVELFVGG
jgi:peptidase E